MSWFEQYRAEDLSFDEWAGSCLDVLGGNGHSDGVGRSPTGVPTNALGPSTASAASTESTLRTLARASTGHSGHDSATADLTFEDELALFAPSSNSETEDIGGARDMVTVREQQNLAPLAGPLQNANASDREAEQAGSHGIEANLPVTVLPAPKKRGRPRGSTATEMVRRKIVAGKRAPPPQDLEPVEPEQAPEQAPEPPAARDFKAMAHKRWEAWRASKACGNCSQAVVPFQDGAVGDLRLVPYAKASGEAVEYPMDAIRAIDHATGSALVEWQSAPAPPGTDFSQQKRFLMSCTMRESKSSKAEKIDAKHTSTVSRQLRLTGVLLIMYRRFHMAMVMKAFDKHLRMIAKDPNSVKPVWFGLKYRYDEMSLKVSLDEHEESKAVVPKLAKLLQVTTFWLGLWAFDDHQFVRLYLRCPTTVRAIEKNSAQCLRNALKREAIIPQFAHNMFAERTRIPVADAHSANNACDRRLWADDQPGSSMAKTVCKAHACHRVAGLLSDTSPNEPRGLLHFCLSLTFGGCEQAFKEQWKKRVSQQLRVYHHGEYGAGREAEQHRESILAHYACSADTRTSGPRVEMRLKQLMILRRLWNGRWLLADRCEHFCKGRGCCSDEADTLKQMHSFIDEYQLPGPWCRSRWLGIDPAINTVGLLSNMHGTFCPVYEAAFGEKKAKKAVLKRPAAAAIAHAAGPAIVPIADGGGVADAELDIANDGDEDADAEDAPLPEDVLDMPVPEKALAEEVRQSTFRKNTLLWAKSGGVTERLWAFAAVMKTQQRMFKELIRNASDSFRRAEWLRRSQGHAPRYLPLMALSGFFTLSPMKEYGAQMCSKAPWQSMPAAHRTHEFAITAFRMSACAAAATQVYTHPTILGTPLHWVQDSCTSPRVGGQTSGSAGSAHGLHQASLHSSIMALRSHCSSR